MDKEGIETQRCDADMMNTEKAKKREKGSSCGKLKVSESSSFSLLHYMHIFSYTIQIIRRLEGHGW